MIRWIDTFLQKAENLSSGKFQTLKIFCAITLPVLALVFFSSTIEVASFFIFYTLLISLVISRLQSDVLRYAQNLEYKIRERTRACLIERAKFEALLKKIEEGVVSIDTKGLVTFVNSSAEKMFGWKQDELLGKSFADEVELLDENGTTVLSAARPIIKVLDLGAPVLITTTTHFIVRKDKTKIPVEIVSTPSLDEDGVIIGATSIFKDVTAAIEVGNALKASELRYNRLFETTEGGVLLINLATGMVIGVNRFLCELLGYSKYEFVGKYLWEIAIFKEVFWTKKNFLELQAKRDMRYEDIPLETKEGKKLDVQILCAVYQVGDIEVIQCNVHDITDLKKVEQKMSAILATVGEAVVVCDTQGMIVLFNKVARKLTGVFAGDAIGRHYHEALNFVREKDGKPGVDYVQEAMRGNAQTTMEDDMVLQNKSGQKIPVTGSAAPIKDSKGYSTSYVIVFRDTTHERSISRAKSEFVSLASHQLRTPVLGIEWTADLFLKKEKLTKQGKKYLDDIRFSTHRLNTLVKLLLNASRVESGKIEMKPELLDLIPIIEAYLEECAIPFTKKGLTLVFDAHPKELFLRTDRNLFGYIIQNLIANAFDYTPQGGRIDVAIEQKENKIIFLVRDTGIGIPKEEQPRIFGKFIRASNAAVVKTDGTGLGLYIVAEEVGLLGGRVWFDSTEGEGSTFFVELPLTGGK